MIFFFWVSWQVLTFLVVSFFDVCRTAHVLKEKNWIKLSALLTSWTRRITDFRFILWKIQIYFFKTNSTSFIQKCWYCYQTWSKNKEKGASKKLQEAHKTEKLWKQCALPVITTMALWKLMQLGTWRMVTHCYYQWSNKCSTSQPKCNKSGFKWSTIKTECLNL